MQCTSKKNKKNQGSFKQKEHKKLKETNKKKHTCLILTNNRYKCHGQKFVSHCAKNLTLNQTSINLLKKLTKNTESICYVSHYTITILFFFFFIFLSFVMTFFFCIIALLRRITWKIDIFNLRSFFFFLLLFFSLLSMHEDEHMNVSQKKKQRKKTLVCDWFAVKMTIAVVFCNPHWFFIYEKSRFFFFVSLQKQKKRQKRRQNEKKIK